jgi:hypothetical protein
VNPDSVEYKQRVFKQVELSGACWIWQGNKDTCGYGVIKLHQKGLKAHRVMWEIANQRTIENLYVLHKCDTPACVNPDHLFLGTPKDNAIDRSRKGRSGDVRGALNGRAKLTGEQVAEIREIFQNHKITKRALARLYGVTDVQIGHIIRDEQWKEID